MPQLFGTAPAVVLFFFFFFHVTLAESSSAAIKHALFFRAQICDCVQKDAATSVFSLLGRLEIIRGFFFFPITQEARKGDGMFFSTPCLTLGIE